MHLGFNVGPTPPTAVTQGVELEGPWQMTESLMFTGAAWRLVRSRVKDYENGSVPSGSGADGPLMVLELAYSQRRPTNMWPTVAGNRLSAVAERH